MLLQFVSPPPSQNQPLCSVTTTRNSSEHENRNRTGYTLEMLHNRKSQRCIRWLFLMNTRTDTVPIFRGTVLVPGVTTVLRGQELHLRPSGYEPDELLLLHPAMRHSIANRGGLLNRCAPQLGGATSWRRILKSRRIPQTRGGTGLWRPSCRAR